MTHQCGQTGACRGPVDRRFADPAFDPPYTGPPYRAGSVTFGGTEAAELFGRECTESLRGTLALSYAGLPNTPYAPGFVHASPPQQYWSGTCWARDTAVFLRELVLWGLFPLARLTAGFLMDRAPLAANGYVSFPEYLRGDESLSPFELDHGHVYHVATDDEIDGTASIVVALTLLWRRLQPHDPLRMRIETFLLGRCSPLRGFQQQLQSAPLLAGQGEFAAGTEGADCCNVVQNYLASLALTSASLVAQSCGAAADAADWSRDAAAIQASMLRHLVDAEGRWIWCVDSATLTADPVLLVSPGLKGFGGINAVASSYADVVGLEPGRCAWPGIECCRRTFERLLSEPGRRRQFDRHGLWTQLDSPTVGLYSTPSYSAGYALQTMLLYDMHDRAGRLAGWLAEATYRAEEFGILFTNFTTGRMSPWYFFERYCSPDAVGVMDMLAGCGPLNLVNVAEPLKAARLMLGVDDSCPHDVRIIPRLPGGWTIMEATDWPILTPEGVVRADIACRSESRRFRFNLRLKKGVLPRLSVRLPAGSGFAWHRAQAVTQISL